MLKAVATDAFHITVTPTASFQQLLLSTRTQATGSPPLIRQAEHAPQDSSPPPKAAARSLTPTWPRASPDSSAGNRASLSPFQSFAVCSSQRKCRSPDLLPSSLSLDSLALPERTFEESKLAMLSETSTEGSGSWNDSKSFGRRRAGAGAGE
ncbi:MAG: hypothetical protein SGPRY_014501, partial [Prymnesium sp.]